MMKLARNRFSSCLVSSLIFISKEKAWIIHTGWFSVRTRKNSWSSSMITCFASTLVKILVLKVLMVLQVLLIPSKTRRSIGSQTYKGNLKNTRNYIRIKLRAIMSLTPLSSTWSCATTMSKAKKDLKFTKPRGSCLKPSLQTWLNSLINRKRQSL